MSYNDPRFQGYMYTAGKVTLITSFAGVLVFLFVFLVNLGTSEIKQAIAQSGVATTTITVLNTPPSFDFGPVEAPDSSTTTPTNSGDNVTWTAIATDPSGEDYFLLICDGNTASPTAYNGAPPTCGAGDDLWARSGTTTSGAVSSAATTTLEAFAETNVWFAWVCDAVANARCVSTPSQGTATSSSPFYVNHRPTFTFFQDDSPADPGTTVTFYATSTDPDTVTSQDTVQLHVCTTNSFTGGTCDATTLATSTYSHPDATATYDVPTIRQDDDYEAWGFIIDEHGHVSTGVAQGTNATMTVNNVAPTVAAGSIRLNNGNDIDLVEGVETTGFVLDFVVTDNNSCDAVGGGLGDEFSTSSVSVFHTFYGSSSCNSFGDYDPNYCYTNERSIDVWNLQCTASSTTCTGASDPTMTVECTFPMWFVADPTDGIDASSTVHWNEAWTAGVAASDDDFATSSFTQGTGATAEVTSVLALNLADNAIPYPSLEPNTNSGTTNASTTVEATGNVGIDEALEGTNMCPGFESGNPGSCAYTASNATHTIPVYEQEFSANTFAYGAGTSLATTSTTTLQIDVLKPTATSTFPSAETYWGIAVPGTITYAGAYTGENTYYVVLSDPSQW